MKITHKSQFGTTYQLKAQITKYANGDNAIKLYDLEDGLPYATASVSVEGLADWEVAIKNYSENAGILQSLVEAKIVDAPHRVIRQGYALIPVCKLLNA